MKKGFAVGLLGGSFNPAHGGHRKISVAALRQLRLDEIWWLVSPQNPLKAREGMAPYGKRLRRAMAVARHPRIRVSAFEAERRTVKTADTIRALRRRYPQVRFLWMMGSDNLLQFDSWAEWRRIAESVPIVVVARPPYVAKSRMAAAMGWMQRGRHRSALEWREWHLPGMAFVDYGLDRSSATGIRKGWPGWAEDQEATVSAAGASGMEKPGAGNRAIAGNP